MATLQQRVQVPVQHGDEQLQPHQQQLPGDSWTARPPTIRPSANQVCVVGVCVGGVTLCLCCSMRTRACVCVIARERREAIVMCVCIDVSWWRGADYSRLREGRDTVPRKHFNGSRSLLLNISKHLCSCLQTTPMTTSWSALSKPV